MTVRTTPIFIDGNTHPAEETRLAIGALLGTATGSFAGGVSAVDSAHGVINFGDLAVTQNGTPNMSVNVAAGGAFIRGTQSAAQGVYHLFNDGSINVGLATSDSANPRRDLVVAQIRDAFYSGGSTKDARITVITGTAAASPVDPAVPANCLVLARVAVGANVSSVTTANITDLRTYARTEWNSPWGYIGATTRTTNLAATNANIVTYSLSAIANRRYRITAGTGSVSSSVDGDIAGLAVYAAGAKVAGVNIWCPFANTGYFGGTVVGYYAPSSSGTVTIAAYGARVAGSGTVTWGASSTSPIQLYVEDIGPTAR